MREPCHTLDLHVSVLEQPFIGLLEQDRADQPSDSSPYDVAKFEWRALWDRRSLKAQYGEGFRASAPASPGAGAPGRAEERAHGAARKASRVADPQRLRGDTDGGTVPGRGIRAPDTDPTPPASAACNPRPTYRRGRRRSTQAEER